MIIVNIDMNKNNKNKNQHNNHNNGNNNNNNDNKIQNNSNTTNTNKHTTDSNNNITNTNNTNNTHTTNNTHNTTNNANNTTKNPLGIAPATTGQNCRARPLRVSGLAWPACRVPGRVSPGTAGCRVRRAGRCRFLSGSRIKRNGQKHGTFGIDGYYPCVFIVFGILHDLLRFLSDYE